MDRFLAARLLREDMSFRNIVFYPKTLRVRFVYIKPWGAGAADLTPKQVWLYLDAGFLHWFGYTDAAGILKRDW